MKREITIELAGLKLPLKFEAENLMKLSELVKKPAYEFIHSHLPDSASDKVAAGMRCSDLGFVVPVIMAGLAHHREYDGLSDRELRRKVCGMLDAEAERRNQTDTLVTVCAKLIGPILPMLVVTMIPPGVDIDAAIAKTKDGKEEGQEAPLDSAPEVAPVSPDGQS